VERRFKFRRFVPPGIVQRIMAELYFDGGNGRQVMISDNLCWRNSFCQYLGNYSVESDRYEKPARILVVLEKIRDHRQQHKESHLRIIGYGLFIHYPSILESLTHYCEVVESKILSKYLGVLQYELTFVCPMCVTKSVPESAVGEFFPDNLRKLDSSEKSVVCDKGCHVALDRLVCSKSGGSLILDPTQSYVQFLKDEVA
jgi:hypothetical protein